MDQSARVMVNAQPVTPPLGGLFAHAVVIENGDARAASFGFEYEPAPTAIASVDVDRCLVENQNVTKTIRNGVPEVTSETFVIYYLTECSLDTVRENSERAAQGLRLGTQRAVEEQVYDRFLSENTTTVLGGGAAQSPKRALGSLEGHLGATYSGTPLLHVPRMAVPFIPDLTGSDGVLTTKQGTPVANGFGYTANTSPAGVVPADGEVWLYGSGTVVIHLGPVREVGAHVLSNNRTYALAERYVSVSVEDPIVAVRVDLE